MPDALSAAPLTDIGRRRAIAFPWAAAALSALGGCQGLPARPSGAPTADAWAGWDPYPLPGKRATVYERKRIDGRVLIAARADASASMLKRSLRIEPDALGELEFSWRVDRAAPDASTAVREREDAPARIVLAFDGDMDRLDRRTRLQFETARALTGDAPPFATLMYVWDDSGPVDRVVVNPRTDRIRKIVVDAGAEYRGQWRAHRRDVRADFRRAFGEDPGALTAMALMTDSDNTRGRTDTLYGEIRWLPAAHP